MREVADDGKIAVFLKITLEYFFILYYKKLVLFWLFNVFGYYCWQFKTSYFELKQKKKDYRDRHRHTNTHMEIDFSLTDKF